jgi:hypothetical protein
MGTVKSQFMTEDSVATARIALEMDGFVPDDNDPGYHSALYNLAALIGELMAHVREVRLIRWEQNGVVTFQLFSGMLELGSSESARSAYEQAYKDFTPCQTLAGAF